MVADLCHFVISVGVLGDFMLFLFPSKIQDGRHNLIIVVFFPKGRICMTFDTHGQLGSFSLSSKIQYGRHDSHF